MILDRLGVDQGEASLWDSPSYKLVDCNPAGAFLK